MLIKKPKIDQQNLVEVMHQVEKACKVVEKPNATTPTIITSTSFRVDWRTCISLKLTFQSYKFIM